MITVPDDKKSQLPSDQKIQTEEPHVGLDEPPPSYSAQAESGSSSVSSYATYKTKATNFLALSTRDSTINGEFIVNPSMRIPSSLLPPLGDNETEDDRKNLSLTSKHSSVHADIWLLSGSPLPSESATSANKPRRTTIRLASEHGSIRAQLHTIDGAAPFSLTGHSSHGTIRLAVPRSFHGFLSISTRHGSIKLSDTLFQNTTQLSQFENTRKYFIGDFHPMEDTWDGDQVELEAPHGSIRVKYIDEMAEMQGKKGLFSRLFGK